MRLPQPRLHKRYRVAARDQQHLPTDGQRVRTTPPSLFAGEVGVSSSSSNVTAVNDILTKIDLDSFNTCISAAESNVDLDQDESEKNVIEGLLVNQRAERSCRTA